MALTYIYCYEGGIKRDEDCLGKADEFVQKVKKLKPDSPHYYHLQARLERYRGSAINSIGLLKKALVRNPNNVDALFFQGYLLAVFAGKPELAGPYVKKLLDIDPLTPFNYFVPMMLSNMRGEMAAAVDFARKMCKMGLEHRIANYFVSRMLSLAGRLDEAFEVIDELAMEDSKDLMGSLSLFSKYALQGEKDKALLILTEDAKKFAWIDPEFPLYMTGYYSLINEKEEAFKWLEHTINRGLINYPLLSEKDPFLANIRSEPRFKKLMERVKYEWEHFEV
jgi:tetratricopeptide (TPR) repeat protein